MRDLLGEMPAVKNRVTTCATDGCMRFTVDGGVCARCREEIAALEKLAARRSAWADWVYLAGVMYAMGYLMFELRGWILECLQLWFGR